MKSVSEDSESLNKPKPTLTAEEAAKQALLGLKKYFEENFGFKQEDIGEMRRFIKIN